MIDEFIKGRPEFSSRSQLARVALREFVVRDAGPAEEEDGVNVRFPHMIKGALEGMRDAGVYNSVEEAVLDLVRRGMFSEEDFQSAKHDALRSYDDYVRIVNKRPR